MTDWRKLEELWTAAETGDHTLVDDILGEGVIAPDITDEEGITLVHTAAANGHEKVVECLIKRGANVNPRSFYQWTPLMQASAYGQISCTSLLVESNAELDATNVMGASALVCAARGGHTSVVHSLLVAGASVNNKLGAVDPLMSAAIAGHESVCRLLIDKGANVNCVMKDTGWTPLMFAAHNGYLQVVQVLCTNGANTNAVNALESIALDLSIASDHTEVERYLTKHSDTSLSNTMKRRQRADLFQATKDGDFEQVKKLMDGDNADVNRKDDDGATCLIFACMRGWLAIAELLVDNGALVDIQDEKSGWTALMQATYYGHKSIVRLLIDSGADISLQAGNGCTASDIASIIGDTEVVHLLMQARMRVGLTAGMPQRKQSRISTDAVIPAPRTPSPMKGSGSSPKLLPRGSPQPKQKQLTNQPNSLLSLRRNDRDATLRTERGPSTLAALADAGAELGEDTLRSSQHSLGTTFGSGLTSTMGSTMSADAGLSISAARRGIGVQGISSSLQPSSGKKREKKEKKGSSLRPFSSSKNKVSPGKPGKVSSSGSSRPGSAEKKSGKKKNWWRRTAARFAKFLRRSARIEVSPTGPASGSSPTEGVRQSPSAAWGVHPKGKTQVQSSNGGGAGPASGVLLPTATTPKRVNTLDKNDKSKFKAKLQGGNLADAMVLRQKQQQGRASSASISSTTKQNLAAIEQADKLKVRPPVAPNGPASPRKNGGVADAMNVTDISQMFGKRPSMGAPTSWLPPNIMAPIKPPFMPPPAFELHHIERPKFERPSTRALPDGGSLAAAGGEPRPRSSKPFVRPSIAGSTSSGMGGRASRDSMDRKKWSLPRKSVPNQASAASPASKFGPGPKKRPSGGPRVSFLSPPPAGDDAKKRGGSTSSSGSGAAGSTVATSNTSSATSLGSSSASAGPGPRKRANPKEPTLKDVLQRHGMMDFYLLFSEQDVDLEAFLLMTNEDMVELGIDDTAARTKLCSIIAKIRGSKRAGISRVDSAVTLFRNANAQNRRGSGLMPPRRAGSTTSVSANTPMPVPPKTKPAAQGKLPQVREAAGRKKAPAEP